MSRLNVPIISIIIGEGGSGGALAIGVGDSVLMFENAIYSVISPEGCAAILWKDSTVAPRASEALKLTANDLFNLGVVDKVIEEPAGGAQLSLQETTVHLEKGISEGLRAVNKMRADERIIRRYRKLRRLGLM
jgi:acetyl-CoA carboxylase carboxyl transferase subunit alpha